MYFLYQFFLVVGFICLLLSCLVLSVIASIGVCHRVPLWVYGIFWGGFSFNAIRAVRQGNNWNEGGKERIVNVNRLTRRL